MSTYVIDTQALVKLLNGKKVINATIDNILQGADSGKNIIVIPSVVLFEIGYLHEKGRISVSLAEVKDVLAHSLNYMEEALSLAMIEAAFGIPDIPELHDRLIAGTARYLNVPVLTNDPLIRASKFVTCVREETDA